MNLPPLLDAQQYAERAGRASRPLVGDELAQFQAFAQDASGRIRRVAGHDFVTGDDPPVLAVPADLLPVAFRVIDRAMENRLAHDSQTDGTWTWRKEGAGPGGVYLSEVDEDEIRDVIGVGRFQAVPLVSPWSGEL